MRSNISNDISANVLWRLIFHVRLAALLSYLLRIHFFVLLYIVIIHLILLQCFLTFIMTFWNFQNIFSTYDCQWLLFPLSGNLCLCICFHMLWKLFQDIHGQKYHMCHKICKKYLFFVTLSVFDENTTKSWEDEINKRLGKVRKNQF